MLADFEFFRVVLTDRAGKQAWSSHYWMDDLGAMSVRRDRTPWMFPDTLERRIGLPALAALLPAQGPVADAIDEIDAISAFMHCSATRHFSHERNLSQAGREQSRRIGQYLRDEAIGIEVILSSRWCRCVETAAELGLGPFTTHDGLNSFFDGHVDRAETIRLLRAYLDSMKASPANGSITLMVTHQVVITAITGIAPQSGGFVAYNSRTGAVKRAGTPVQP